MVNYDGRVPVSFMTAQDLDLSTSFLLVFPLLPPEASLFEENENLSLPLVSKVRLNDNHLIFYDSDFSTIVIFLSQT